MQDEDDAHGRQGGIEHIEPVAEIPVEPNGSHRADGAGHKHHGLLGEAEDVGKAQAGRVEGVVIGGPDVQAKDQDGQIEEVQVEHHLEDVVSAGIDAGNGAEQEHKAVTQEERHHRDDEAHLPILGKTREIGCCRTAGNETSHHQAGAGNDSHVLGALGKLFHHAGISVTDGQNHGNRTQDSHGGDGYVAYNGKAPDSVVGRRRHQHTGNGNQQVALQGHIVRSHIQAHYFLGDGDGEHGQTYAEPPCLRETDHRAGKPASLGAETAAGQHIQGETAFGSNPTQGSGVSRQDEAAQQHGPQEIIPVQAIGQLLAHPHAGAEEGEAQHHHKHAQVAFAAGLVYGRGGVVRIDDLVVIHIAVSLF